MKIHHAIEPKADATRPLAIAIGFFDGVHRGHREIVRALRAHRRLGGRIAAMTFRRHPAAFLRPGTEPPLITTVDERVNLLAECGIDELYLIDFDAAIATLSWRAFLDRLIDDVGVGTLCVGENFRFGRGREGDAAMASAYLADRGRSFVAVPPLLEGGERISSTRIRAAIASGDLGAANALLGAPYVLRGRVELGEGRGHDLGFPTANVRVPPEKLVPMDGVYAIVARHDGRDYRGLVSIGTNPTFGGNDRTIEAWLRDFGGSLYGHELAIRDFRFVREQRAFGRVEDLVTQMREDATHAAFPTFS